MYDTAHFGVTGSRLQMKIEIKTAKQGVEFVSLHGELDFNSTPDLRRQLKSLIEKKTPTVLIDFQAVGYIDSSGLATFIELFQQMKTYQGKLIFFNLTESVRSVFEIAKLDSIFQLSKTEKDALALIS